MPDAPDAKQPRPPPPPPPRRVLAHGDEHVTAESGSRAFRALNFELYAVSVRECERESVCWWKRWINSLNHPCLHPTPTQKPVGFVRHLSIAGTVAAAGVLIYFWVQGQQQQQQEAARRAQRVERRL